MDNFHKKPQKHNVRSTIDGILNAPTNRDRNAGIHAPGQGASPRQPLAKQPNRVIGDFTRANTEGYHSADNTASGRLSSAQATAKRTVETHQEIRRPHAAVAEPKKLTRRERKKLARKERRAKRPTWRKVVFRSIIVLIILAAALAGFLFTKGYFTINSVFKGGGSSVALDGEVDPIKLKGEGDGRVNILLLGRGGEGHDGPDLTDTILIASIDPVNKKAALLSIPRDLWVKTSAGNSKINAVFANAKNKALRTNDDEKKAEIVGIAAIKTEITDVLGINIHYYAMIDFEGFRQAVDTVGGVTIDVPEELRDSSMAWQNNGNPVIAKAGVQNMDGKKALMYVRSRHGSARGDFDRAERQRLFIIALKNEILSAGTYSNPLTLSRLMDDFGNHAQTDFSVTDLSRLYALSGGISNIESIGLVDAPHNYLTTGTISGQSIVQPKAGTFEYEEIQSYLRSALPDGYILKENAPLRVLNGTTIAGIATTMSDELKSYKYNVTIVDDAPSKNYTKTLLIDLTGKNPYTKNYLEKRLGTAAIRDVPAELNIPEQDRKGFVIIIGSNETITR